MKENTLIIDIGKNVTEDKLIENCLMYYHSGYDYKLMLSLYAMAKQWKINKLVYYISLIEK